MVKYNCRAAYIDKNSTEPRSEEFPAATPHEAVEEAEVRKGERNIHSVWFEDEGFIRLLWMNGSYQDGVASDKPFQEIFPFLH